jgi:hypothetical protein
MGGLKASATLDMKEFVRLRSTKPATDPPGTRMAVRQVEASGSIHNNLVRTSRGKFCSTLFWPEVRVRKRLTFARFVRVCADRQPLALSLNFERCANSGRKSCCQCKTKVEPPIMQMTNEQYCNLEVSL